MLAALGLKYCYIALSDLEYFNSTRYDLYPNVCKWYEVVVAKLAPRFLGKASGVRIEGSQTAPVEEQTTYDDDDLISLVIGQEGDRREASCKNIY